MIITLRDGESIVIKGHNPYGAHLVVVGLDGNVVTNITYNRDEVKNDNL